MPPAQSTMLPLGTALPDFKLPDSQGTPLASGQARGARGTLVMVMCNHCPFVVHVVDEIARVAALCTESGIGVAGICANDAERYPQDGPEAMARFAEQHGLAFPYLFDESQDVVKALAATCTPEFYLFDADAKLYYRGQLDASRPGRSVAVTGADLRAAIAQLLSGDPPPEPQLPSIGCSIKWKPGNEPGYLRS